MVFPTTNLDENTVGVSKRNYFVSELKFPTRDPVKNKPEKSASQYHRNRHQDPTPSEMETKK